MRRLLILAIDGLSDSSLALTLDSIATANRVAEATGREVRLDATLFCPHRRRIRTAMGGMFAVESSVRISRFDALIVPGLGLTSPAAVDEYLTRRSAAPIVEWLRRVGGRCPVVAASCSSVFLLAEAGLLADRSATTTWWLSACFRERYPDVELDETRMVVESRGVVCAGAALAQIDLMLHLIERLASPEISRGVSRYLAIERRSSQARYMMLSALQGIGDDITGVERWIRANRSRTFTIREMARALGMSTRTLDRRVRAATGHGASRFIQRLRLEHATHLIETSDLPLGEVAARVGYRDASTLRRLMRRDLGVNPSDLRVVSP